MSAPKKKSPAKKSKSAPKQPTMKSLKAEVDELRKLLTHYTETMEVIGKSHSKSIAEHDYKLDVANDQMQLLNNEFAGVINTFFDIERKMIRRCDETNDRLDLHEKKTKRELVALSMCLVATLVTLGATGIAIMVMINALPH